MTHRQLVSMAPLTASSSGRTTYTINAIPIVWNDSIRNMNRKCDLNGTFHDLKKQIRAPRISAPSSGTAKAIISAHIHAIRSSSGSIVINVLSRPYATSKITALKDIPKTKFVNHLLSLCCSTRFCGLCARVTS